MTVRTRLAYLAALATVLMGLFALLFPAQAVRLLGLEVVGPRGFGAARSVFGALFVTMGAYMAWAVAARPRSRGVLRLTGTLWLAMALGTLLSMLVDIAFASASVLWFVVEALVGLLALLAAGEARPARRGQRASEDAPDPLRAYRG